MQSYHLLSCGILQDMRQKFDAEGPAEQEKTGQKVDRSQGAARAITVCTSSPSPSISLLTSVTVIHRSGAELEGP